MIKSVKKVVLDTVRSNRNISISAVKGDYNARFIAAVMTSDGVPVAVPKSAVATINAFRSDGEARSFKGEICEDGSVIVPITQWMLEVPHSSCRCTVSATSDTEKLSTTDFYVSVQDTPYEGDVISEDDPEYDVLVLVLAGEASREEAESKRAAAEIEREQAERERSEVISELDRRVKVLESGVIAGFESDSEVAYVKTVPANVLAYAELEKSGVNTGRYTTSNFYTGDRNVTISAPYEVGVKKELCKVRLPAGMYYIHYSGSFNGYVTDESTARIMINDIESRYVTLDTTQMVTVYAVMYVDYSSNGPEFMSHTFTDVGVFAVSYEGEIPPYDEPSGAEVITAPLTAIISNGKTYTIPEKYIELQRGMVSGDGGYGSDYIDWANSKLVRCMKSVDAGTLTWRLSSGRFQATISGMKSVSASDAKIGVLFEGYQYLGTGTSVLTEGGMATNKALLYVQDGGYATAAEFKEAMSGKMIYYETAEEPEIIDIDTSEFDRFIEVKPGGTIRFVNIKNGAILSTITYQLKEA